MGKKAFERAIARRKVQAVYSRFKRDENGMLTNIRLYDIYGPEYLK